MSEYLGVHLQQPSTRTPWHGASLLANDGDSQTPKSLRNHVLIKSKGHPGNPHLPDPIVKPILELDLWMVL